MKEYLVFRVIKDFAHLLFSEDERIDIGSCIVDKVYVDINDPRLSKIGELQDKIRKKYDRLFFSSYEYVRKYSNKELQDARFFRIIQTRFFEPSGEECGTVYDENTACQVCGAGAKMVTRLKLKKSSIPKVDTASTIAGNEEAVFSEKFVQIVRANNLTGMDFEPIMSCGKDEKVLNYYQIRPKHYIDISKKTIFGINPFDLSGECKSFTEVYRYPDGTEERKFFPHTYYKCPNGDNLGLNILSETFIKGDPILENLDFFESRQTYGVRIGLLRQNRLFFCSNRMMKLIKENHLKGFRFEVAHIVNE